MTTAELILQELRKRADVVQAENSRRFFKTGKGEYGESDVFLGIKLPEIKALVKEYAPSLDFVALAVLFRQPYHEARTVAARSLVWRYEHSRGNAEAKRQIVDFYLASRAAINNWDLVDVSAYRILGAYVYETGERSVLYRLAEENSLWSQRMSVVACLYLIKKDDFADIKKLSVRFLAHPNDLMRKAVGWMLREMGKRSEAELRRFLDEYAARLSRTALRYAIERLAPEQRRHYMDMKQ